ncbi:hypothetical protein [Zavarzinella formosa]|uniref:hypothetical protein n=1 Tax=Zavarzinella formosa TaxID=360055 RepID=UPI0002DD7BDE|nr:hypothetical protein [Zavarzinella formosa]
MRLLTGLTLMFLVGTIAADEATAWTKIISKKGKYEVSFPGKVIEKAVDGNGLQTMLGAMDGKALYMTQVNFFSATVDPSNKDWVDTKFKTTRDAFVKTLGNPKVLAETNGLMGELPTKDVDLEVVGGIYRARWIISPKGFYQILIAGPKDFVDGKDAKKFMESFKLDTTD